MKLGQLIEIFFTLNSHYNTLLKYLQTTKHQHQSRPHCMKRRCHYYYVDGVLRLLGVFFCFRLGVPGGLVDELISLPASVLSIAHNGPTSGAGNVDGEETTL